MFGEGESSTPVEKGTNEQIPPEAVHITNKTVFDDGVIVAKHIGDNAIVGTKIAEGAITTDKISANAITSGKIATNAITTDKIAANAITSNHMEINSIEGNRIKASSIDADRLKANSITGDKLVADSITGDKIQAGSITVDKLGAGVIDLKELGSAIQGGSVRIDGTGMSVGQNNGSYTKFNESGLIWYDNKGIPYGSVRRMIKGEARHGDRININWDTTPFVMVTPDVIPIYGTNSAGRLGQEIHCRAINVSKDGFEIEAFTQLEKPDGLTWAKPWDYVETERTSDIIVWAPYETPIVFTVRKGIQITVNGGEVFGEAIPPEEIEYRGRQKTLEKNEMVKTGRLELYQALKREGGHDGDHHYKGYDSYRLGPKISKRLSSQPFDKLNITLKKGLNVISGIVSDGVGFDLAYNESLGWIIDPPDFLKFYIPFDAPVKFIAIDFPIENYYSVQKTGFVIKNISGRGVQKFKPQNRRFKIVLIGASSAIGKPRPDSSETKISWESNVYSTNESQGFFGDINNNQEKKYYVDDWHGSWKYNEQPPQVFFASDFGLGFPYGWSVKNTPFKLPGYLENSSIPFFSEINSVNKDYLTEHGDSPTFKMSWELGSRMNKWNDGYFGPAIKIVGASVPTKIQSNSFHGARGGYHREMHGYIQFQMGLSKPIVKEISIPEDQPIPEFTITIAACPDAWVGKRIPLEGAGLDGRDYIEIVDTKSFDGGVIIIEEEASKQVS